MSSSPLPSPIGTPGISSPYPSPRLHLRPTPPPHISKALMTERARGRRPVAWDVNAGLRNRHPLLSFRENDPLLLCFTFSRFFTHGEIGERMESSIGCMKSYFRGRYGKQRTPLVIFLFAFAASVFRYMFGLFKKNGISSTCFFIDRTWKISSENEPFSPSHMCVYIVFTQMPSDIFIYTSFCAGEGTASPSTRDEGIISMKERRQSTVGTLLSSSEDMLMLSSFYTRHH